MRAIPDEYLRVYIVWQPIRSRDDREHAEKRMKEFVDPRLSYYWDANLAAAEGWAPVLGVEGLAWDLYFVYGLETQWTTAPPFPDFWMHQLEEVKDKAPRLVPETLIEETEKRLYMSVN